MGNRFVLITIFLNLFTSSHILFREPFEFYTGYLGIILLIPIWAVRYPFPANIGWLLVLTLPGGIVGIYSGDNTWPSFFKIFINLTLALFFYYYLCSNFKGNVLRLFHYYIIGAKIVVVIGMFQAISYIFRFTPGYDYGFILNKWGVCTGGIIGIRINALCPEPSYLAIALSPACFVAAYNLIYRKNEFLNQKWSCLVLIVLFLTASSTGYLGFFVILLLVSFNLGITRWGLLFISLGLISHYVFMETVVEYQYRASAMTELSRNRDEVIRLGKIDNETMNSSAFVLFNHAHVTWENLKKHPFFGSGIGSHQYAFKKHSLFEKHFLFERSGGSSILWGLGSGLGGANSQDANSMGLRIASEMGILGLIAIAVFIIKFGVWKSKQVDNTKYWLISGACLNFIVLKLLRDGNYTYNGTGFYFMVYYFTWLKNHELINGRPAVRKRSKSRKQMFEVSKLDRGEV